MSEALLEMRSVQKRFGGLVATDAVSLAVGRGQIVGLIGPNGAGKTTLFALASGFLRPDAGEIVFDGRRVEGLAPPALCRAGMARTFQIVRPFGEMSVLENAMVGAFLRTADPAEAAARAGEVLQRVGLGGREGQVASTLNLAGRKRLEVAKALATAPKLLLLDEVMAGLNPVETSRMVELIGELRDGGTSILVIEHNMQAVMRLSDAIVVLHHGRKIAEGPPAQVANDPRVIEAYLGTQTEGAAA